MEKKSPNTVQTAVRLPSEMHDRLKAGGGVSEEIRQRVERTFAEDDIATQAREMAAEVVWLANKMVSLGGPLWHKNHRAYLAFATAITAWLDMRKPAEEDPAAGATETEGLFDAKLDPPTVGMMLARELRDTRVAAKVVVAEINVATLHLQYLILEIGKLVVSDEGQQKEPTMRKEIDAAMLRLKTEIERLAPSDEWQQKKLAIRKEKAVREIDHLRAEIERFRPCDKGRQNRSEIIGTFFRLKHLGAEIGRLALTNEEQDKDSQRNDWYLSRLKHLEGEIERLALTNEEQQKEKS